MQEMTIHSPQTEYTVKGAHGLDGSLDYALSVKLSDALSARASVPGFAGDAAGILKTPTAGWFSTSGWAAR